MSPTDPQRGLFPEPKPERPKKDPMLYVVPANARASKCRGENCGKTVYWVYLKSTGRSVIVDCSPAYAPNHKKHGTPHPSAPRCFPPVHPLAPTEHYGSGMDGQGIDHHGTCADAAQFGRKTGRKNG